MANENQNRCPNDCRLCSECQRLYCAATWSRKMHDRMDEMMERFDRLEEKVKLLDHADEGVFNPMDVDETDDTEAVESDEVQDV